MAFWDRNAFWLVRIPTDVVDVGDELAAQLIDQVQQGMAVEVDPDERAGDAAFIAGERPGIGGTQGINGSFLAGHAVGHSLYFRKRVGPDLTADIRTLS
jgi:hypothetical protein